MEVIYKLIASDPSFGSLAFFYCGSHPFPQIHFKPYNMDRIRCLCVKGKRAEPPLHARLVIYMSLPPNNLIEPRAEFEKPLFAIEDEINRLEQRQEKSAVSETDQQMLVDLMAEHERTLTEIYASLSPWDIVSKVARHPKRPQSTEYLKRVCSDFCQLHGDRRHGDDPAILTGFARIGEHRVVIVAHRKGRNTDERVRCNWGCAQPWGYRKALRNMQLAEKFQLPIVTLVDTPGAFPGIEAEERGQAEAIAVNLREMSRLKTPILSIVIGEGGSGGALGIAVADRLAMLQFSWYSVISPEGCAAILWKRATPETNTAAATALHLTASENLRLGVIDDIIEEPAGGAHRDPDKAADLLRSWILRNLSELKAIKLESLVKHRYARLRKIGSYAADAS